MEHPKNQVPARCTAKELQACFLFPFYRGFLFTFEMVYEVDQEHVGELKQFKYSTLEADALFRFVALTDGALKTFVAPCSCHHSLSCCERSCS